MDDNKRDYLGEARRILAGESMMLPQIEHLRALVGSGVIVPADLWDEIGDFIEGQVDVRDGSDGPLPNTAMHLAGRIEREVKKAAPQELPAVSSASRQALPSETKTADAPGGRPAGASSGTPDPVRDSAQQPAGAAPKSKLDPTSSWPFPIGPQP